MATFDRFAIVGAYYLYMARFGYSALPSRHLRSRALRRFVPSMSLSHAAQWGCQVLCNDDYQETRDAYARLLRRARQTLR